PHLKGYKNSQPVRVGNEAANQVQIDIFGEVIEAISLFANAGGKIPNSTKDLIKRLADYCCERWQEEDSGIWEPRYGVKHMTYSKLMCWVGMDRGIKLAKRLNIRNVDLSLWEKTRDEIKDTILEKGF